MSGLLLPDVRAVHLPAAAGVMTWGVGDKGGGGGKLGKRRKSGQANEALIIDVLLFVLLVLQSSRVILLRLLLLYLWIEFGLRLAVVVASSSLRLDFCTNSAICSKRKRER